MTELAVRNDDDAITGEIVTGDVAPVQPTTVVLQLTQIITVARAAVTHKYTRRTARHLGYVPLGAYAVGRGIWEARSSSVYDKRIAAALAAGQHDLALQWEERKARFLNDRHRRRMERRSSALAVVKASPYIAAGSTGVLLLIGAALGIAEHSIADVIVPVEVVARAVEIIVVVVSVTWGPALLAAPWLIVAGLWQAGRKYAQTIPSGWLAAPQKAGEDGGLVITADTIVLALQHLKIAEIKAASRDGWRPTFTLQPTRDGKGYEAEFSLPLGVTAGMLADKRRVFARNLHRAEIETWVTAGEPGYAKIWVADHGALDGMAPEYPLLHEGTADVFSGVPVGVSPRGDEISAPVVANNGVLGGQMGMGKSNGARVYMLGCALDPLCELDVFVFANNGDFDSYAPRLAVYRKGTEDDTVQAAVQRLQELYEEVARREQRLSDLGAKKVTRGLAEAHPDLRPVVALFSECHELFGHDEYGKLAAELAVKTIKRARKTGIVLWFDTQSSRKEAIPPALVELVSVNACFYVKTWRSNDGFLGDGSFQSGIRATELRPSDLGTSIITGVSGAQFELMKWHYIEVDDDTGYDAATDVIARAMADVAPGTPVRDTTAPMVIEQRDLLADIDAVLGQEKTRLADIPALLKRHAPTWPAYQSMTGSDIRERLDDVGVRTTNTGNVPRLDPADLRRVLAGRE